MSDRPSANRSITASVYIATSLDGFIAREDGDLDWLLGATSSTDDHGYADYMETIDTLVMGRVTFEKVLTFGQWPYAEKRVVILSTTLTMYDVPETLFDAVEIHPGPVSDLIDYLDSTGSSSIYVDGGKVVQSFLKEGQIDEITLTRIPVLIGTGIPLFGDAGGDIQLQHLRTKAFASGFVQSTYRVQR